MEKFINDDLDLRSYNNGSDNDENQYCTLVVS